MVTLHKQGQYKLIETKHQNRKLYLDNNIYAWSILKNMNEIFLDSHKIHKSDCVLSTGRYQLFEIADEPYLSDKQHLELEVGNNKWQGYLLPTGLPDHKTKQKRITPTKEIVDNGDPRSSDNKPSALSNERMTYHGND